MAKIELNEDNRVFLMDMLKKFEIDKKLKEEGKEEGREEGREEEKEYTRLKDVERVLKLLKRKFNYSDGAFDEKIKKASSSKLNLIIENILDIERLEDLNKYLN